MYIQKQAKNKPTKRNKQNYYIGKYPSIIKENKTMILQKTYFINTTTAVS